MAELRTSIRGSRSLGRDKSPDSVILNFESQFSSLFSSASVSVDRSSFASDAQDHDSFTSEVSQVSVSFLHESIIFCLYF